MFARLLETYLHPAGGKWTGPRMQEATGGFVNAAYFSNLLSGRIKQPGLDKLKVIAETMGFRPQLWLEEPDRWGEFGHEPEGSARDSFGGSAEQPVRVGGGRAHGRAAHECGGFSSDGGESERGRARGYALRHVGQPQARAGARALRGLRRGPRILVPARQKQAARGPGDSRSPKERGQQASPPQEPGALQGPEGHATDSEAPALRIRAPVDLPSGRAVSRERARAPRARVLTGRTGDYTDHPEDSLVRKTGIGDGTPPTSATTFQHKLAHSVSIS